MSNNIEFVKVEEKMVALFEGIIEKQLNQDIEEEIKTVIEPFPEKTHLLMRDFRNIFISKYEYLRVCQRKGAFSLLHDCGSGSYTNWFLYNSGKRNRLFMVWVHQKSSSVVEVSKDEYLDVLNSPCSYHIDKVMGGFRDDVNRIIQI